MKPALYRDRVVRASVRAIRAQFSEKVFRSLDAVTLDAGDGPVRVRLVRQREPTCFSEERVYLACPNANCTNTRANVIGWDGARVGCTRCLRWRGRSRPRRSADQVADPPKRMSPENIR